MAKPRNRNSTDLDRRKLLRACVQGAAAGIAGLGLSARRAVAEDATLRALTQQNQGGHFDPGFAAVSRAMPMPNPSLPTLSPATVQATEAAIGRYEAILSGGGWPEVQPTVDPMPSGMRHRNVADLRRRLAAVGDLDAGGIDDLYDSHVEAAVRRFQARHGLNVDGVMREQTFRSVNVPVPGSARMPGSHRRFRCIGSTSPPGRPRTASCSSARTSTTATASEPTPRAPMPSRPRSAPAEPRRRPLQRLRSGSGRAAVEP
jgi:putative peptidoglycan binding protein